MNQVLKYFNGEKAESYIFILIGVIALVMALYFFLTFKTYFWKGVAMPILIVSVLEIIVGVTIVTRSPKDINRVERFRMEEPLKIQKYEIPRMEKVMSNFLLFRYIEIILIVLGVFLMYSSMNDTFWRGIGLGLFIQVSIVLTLDFFAERRGYIYLEYLKEFVQNI